MGPYLSLSICKAGGGLHLRPADWGWPRPLDILRRRHQSLQMQAYARSHDGLGTGQARLAGPERGDDRREEKPPRLGGRSGPSTQRKISWESECISLSGGRHRSALRPQSWGAGCPGRDTEPAPGLTIPGTSLEHTRAAVPGGFLWAAQTSPLHPAQSSWRGVPGERHRPLPTRPGHPGGGRGSAGQHELRPGPAVPGVSPGQQRPPRSRPSWGAPGGNSTEPAAGRWKERQRQRDRLGGDAPTLTPMPGPGRPQVG